MKIAHLILAHNEPEQLERLVKRLAYPGADIYIHLDKKTAIAPFEHIKNDTDVFFIAERVKVYWGSYSIVQATLNGLVEIMQSGKGYDYVNLLSGQDYPIQPVAQIHQYLAAHPGMAFMKYLLFNPDWKEALPRVEEYHLNNFRISGRYITQSIINKVLPRRRMPQGLIPVGRSQWFTISTECVSYVLAYLKKHGGLKRFFKFTWAPDEFIFQTILYNSPLKEKMLTNDLRHIDWSGGGVSPKVLTLDDADALFASGAFFARKFDKNKSAALLDFLDERDAG